MRIAELFTTGGNAAVGGPRPRDEDLDLFGMTHVGKVRTQNQDHFLLATVHPQIVIHNTSLPDTTEFPLRGQRLATIMLVADGVGGGVAGEEASRLATETITRYVITTMRCYHSAGPNRDREFLDALNQAAQEAHAAVRADAAAQHHGEINATTMTLGIIVWPWLYVMQVGDSRYYYYTNGKLRQLSRDQTVAQDLVEKGLQSASQAQSSPFNNILSSAIGGDHAAPVVTRVDISDRGSVQLVCSDGLTKHVSDDEIAEHLRTMESAEQVTRALVDLALERGGRDNITVVVGRARRSASKT
jgi:serine/threonine protein phosphatase PrpC